MESANYLSEIRQTLAIIALSQPIRQCDMWTEAYAAHQERHPVAPGRHLTPSAFNAKEFGMTVNRVGAAAADADESRVRDPSRPLWLALMIFFSLVVGAAVGLIASAGGDNPFAAALKGGGSVGATLVVLMAVYHFATAESTGR